MCDLQFRLTLCSLKLLPLLCQFKLLVKRTLTTSNLKSCCDWACCILNNTVNKFHRIPGVAPASAASQVRS